MKRTIYVIATGGGTGAIPHYLERGGASSWFAGLEVPYGMPRFSDCCYGEVWGGKLVSERAAHQLAAEATRRAAQCGSYPIGIGLTASLCKPTGERDGRINEVYIAVVGEREAYTIHYRFDDHNKDRGFQEAYCSKLLQRIIGYYIGEEDHYAATHYYNVDDELDPGGNWEARFNNTDVIPVMPGSYNPVHASHLELYGAVYNRFNVHPIFDISLSHENKAGISPYEFDLRRKWIKDSFMWNNPIVRASYHRMMVDKHGEYKTIFPDHDIVFVMGADVYERISPEDRNHIKMFVFNRDKIKLTPHRNLIISDLKVASMSSTELRKSGEWPS